LWELGNVAEGKYQNPSYCFCVHRIFQRTVSKHRRIRRKIRKHGVGKGFETEETINFLSRSPVGCVRAPSRMYAPEVGRSSIPIPPVVVELVS
jgi:hypothetical protein